MALPLTVGQKIFKLRQSTKLSQEEFAKFIGVSRPTFDLIENDKRALKPAELQKLSQVFEVSALDYQEGVEINTPIPLLKTDPLYKFKQVFLYVLTRCAAKPNVGKTVINKLLYFADFNYYEKYWESITGVDYIKMPRGPVPQVMDAVIAQMEKEHQIKQMEIPYFQYMQQRIIPLVSPDLTAVNGQEMVEIDEVIKKYGDWNAEKLSERSHGDMPRKATKKEGGVISYGLVGYRDEIYAVTQRDGDDD
jgi:transcriptional regulator with XRE-family HTH domain